MRRWLAVQLVHRAIQIGVVVIGPPRAPFTLDQEVYDLLRILGREVATYIAEQRATQIMIGTRQLHDYSKRFAFVAHDIKNVSSQLSLLLSNAESHIANPEFQQDMLRTVGASVSKITALLRRLDTSPLVQLKEPQHAELQSDLKRVEHACFGAGKSTMSETDLRSVASKWLRVAC